MIPPIIIRVYGTPKPQPRPRAFARKFGKKWQARVYDASTAEGWKAQIAEAAKPFLTAAPLSGPLRVDCEFYMPRPKYHFRKDGTLKPKAPRWRSIKPDRDNLDKAVLDCLTQLGMWQDDGQVCDGRVPKLYETTMEPAGVEITISQLEE